MQRDKTPLVLTTAVLTLMATVGYAEAPPPLPKLEGGRLVSARTAKPPTLDGAADDAAWRMAQPLKVSAKGVLPPSLGKSTPVTLRSVHTDADVYFLVEVEDNDQNVSHKTWVWNAAKGSYEEATDREDMVSLAFEHTGEFHPDMLAGVEAVWDLWHWKAFRTNPQGYAMDKTHRYSRTKPEGKATSYQARDGSTLWIARPQDAGETVEVSVPAPTTNQGDRVPAYKAGQPTGSAADVRARGAWKDGRWIIELARRLNTGYADDTPFDTARTHKMGVSVHDRTGNMDQASGVITLTFAGSKSAEGVAGVNNPVGVDFEQQAVGKEPDGFSFGRTGKGEPGEWVVREEPGAPSGQKVLAQVSDDRTSYRFPLAIYDDFTARDVEVSVRFKPVSGRVDQAGGIVWRYQNPDNYYIVRANALEGNVVLYKVQDGTRSDLPLVGEGKTYGKKAPVPKGEWSTLHVVARGDRFEVQVNGKKLYEVVDKTLTGPGKVGLWTKADSVTLFDDLKIVESRR
jgi:ethylbenzene dehydrogenase/3-keto-disaccharide hydrolase